jgi:hypothetical protein
MIVTVGLRTIGFATRHVTLASSASLDRFRLSLEDLKIAGGSIFIYEPCFLFYYDFLVESSRQR